MLPNRDGELVQIVDAALADASARARKVDGTTWLACRPGCTPCCHGVFKITKLDKERLRVALHQLFRDDPLRASALLKRAEEVVLRLSQLFPGDTHSGLLNDDELAWDAFADAPETDLACPALNPANGRCDLYEGRPLTCRIFGPPVRDQDGLGVCELCYVGADEATIVHGEMYLQHHALEEELGHGLSPGETIIAWALVERSEQKW